jgi:hypothetical protein
VRACSPLNRLPFAGLVGAAGGNSASGNRRIELQIKLAF